MPAGRALTAANPSEQEWQCAPNPTVARRKQNRKGPELPERVPRGCSPRRNLYTNPNLQGTARARHRAVRWFSYHHGAPFY